MKNRYRNSAWRYDPDNRDNLTADIPFYIDFAKQQKTEILELGCGTGRVALALRAVIEKAGMEIVEAYSWYDKAPIGGREIIYVCRKG